MLRWLLVATALMLPLSATAVTDGPAPLPVAATDGKPYKASFAIGLTIDGGKSWQDNANLNQTITLKATLVPDPAHVGSVADVFVVQWYAGKFTMLTANNVWVAWSGKVAELQPYLDNTKLAATQDLAFYQGSIATQGEHRLYIGYLPSTSTALIYSGTPAVFQFNAAPANPLTYFQSSVYTNIITAKCMICHYDGGVANSSRLHFSKDQSQVQQNYDIFTNFYKQLPDGYNYVLSKVSGGSGHLGGIQLAVGSSDYQTMAGFLDLLDGATQVSGGTVSNLFDGVATQAATDTLRDAALLFAGRLPTANEVTALNNANGSDASLKTTVMALMQGANFHKFLKDGADDRLFLRGNEDKQLLDDCVACYPALNAQYWTLKDKADASNAAADRAALSLWVNQLNYSLVESPLELIAYVAEHDKPYSEILTANYDMLTPVLNAVVGGTATFASNAASTDFAPGQITDYHLRDATTVLQSVTGAILPRITTAPKLVTTYPHVGVLSSKSFLSRYPSTATNRNRARARWTYYNFLGVDIEALAKRTTDPVALADTNNPTMNNPACTVCHSVLDPVAGTYQFFNDSGIYRSATGGTDSLDNTYKSATPRLYVRGDTWYRDMRVPGFEGTAAPSPSGDTLRWLAQLIVKDARFASATVKFWWPAVIGTEVLKLPEATEDANYQAKLAAYQAQQDEISALASKFTQSGLSLKSLLADMVLSKWYRGDKLTGSQTSSVQSSARSLAMVSDEKLLTPEQLGSKTQALTGFNWNAKADATSGAQINGLEGDYNTFYGGIDGFALKVRQRSLTPMMSNVAAVHAIESSCPIVLGDFIRTDAQRLLFNGITPWTTPMTEQSAIQTMSSTSETDFKSYSLQVTLQPGVHQLVVSLLNDACDFSVSATTCKADKNLVINTLSITKPNGQLTTYNASGGTGSGACAAITNGTRMTLYSSCSATYNYSADQAGTYTITASLAAKQQASDPVLAGLNVEATGSASTATTLGATLIKNELVQLHSKLLGQTVTVTSPEVLASYDLLVQTWLSRKAGNAPPSLLNRTYACDWATDPAFIGTLGYPGNPLQANGSYNTTAVTNWLTPQAQDPLYMKQSWAVVMAYLLSHYDYLHK